MKLSTLSFLILILYSGINNAGGVPESCAEDALLKTLNEAKTTCADGFKHYEHKGYLWKIKQSFISKLHCKLPWKWKDKKCKAYIELSNLEKKPIYTYSAYEGVLGEKDKYVVTETDKIRSKIHSNLSADACSKVKQEIISFGHSCRGTIEGLKTVTDKLQSLYNIIEGK